MNNVELSDLIINVFSQVSTDKNNGVFTTEYPLPQTANTERVESALLQKFEHYKSAKIENGILILVHPDQEN